MSKILIGRAVVEQALLALRIDDLALVRESVVALGTALEQPHIKDSLTTQPQVEQEPIAWANINKQGDITHTSNKKTAWAKTPLYTHPQNLRCKSNQARLATLWGYVKEQPKREPLTVEEKAVIDAARAAMDESTESYNGRGDISIASELAAALSLRLDEYDRAIEAAHGIRSKQ